VDVLVSEVPPEALAKGPAAVRKELRRRGSSLLAPLRIRDMLGPGHNFPRSPPARRRLSPRRRAFSYSVVLRRARSSASVGTPARARRRASRSPASFATTSNRPAVAAAISACARASSTGSHAAARYGSRPAAMAEGGGAPLAKSAISGVVSPSSACTSGFRFRRRKAYGFKSLPVHFSVVAVRHPLRSPILLPRLRPRTRQQSLGSHGRPRREPRRARASGGRRVPGALNVMHHSAFCGSRPSRCATPPQNAEACSSSRLAIQPKPGNPRSCNMFAALGAQHDARDLERQVAGLSARAGERRQGPREPVWRGLQRSWGTGCNTERR
jgi:hypothetical protein